jgi:hypothetical protein
MSEKLELVKKCTFEKMPNLRQHDWDDMLESDGYITFLKGIENAMDLHLLMNYKKFHQFIKGNYREKANGFNEWIDLKRGVIVSTERVLMAYNEKNSNNERFSKHFEDDGAYAD